MEYTVNLETTTWDLSSSSAEDTGNINLCILGGVTDLMVMVCCSYLDSGRAGLWRGVSGSVPSLSCTRRGWWRVFSTPLCVRSEVLGTSGHTGTCRDDRDTETGRWRTEQRGFETRGAADRGRLVREGVGRWFGIREEHSQSGED